LIEAMVYLSLVFAIMGVGFAGLYFCIDASVALRRNADDIANALHAGERWRADIRAAGHGIESEVAGEQQVLHLKGARDEVFYAFLEGEILRRTGDGPWVPLLSHVKSSSMHSESQYKTTAWRWEMELQPQSKGRIKPSRVRPLFTFFAVPTTVQAP